MKRILGILAILFFTSNVSMSQTWTQSLNGRNVWSLSKDNQGNIYAGGLTGTNSRIWKSTNGGNTWDTIYIGAGQTMWDFGFDIQGNIYVANFSNGLLKSTNNGTNFSVTPISQFNNKNLQGVECGDNGHVFVTTSSGFFRSTDSGQTFTETALTGFNCLPVLVDKDSSNIVYVGVSSASGTGIGFYRSSNSGQSFSENLNPGKNGYNLFQKPNGDLYMITTTAPYNLDLSTNKGLTWTTISNLPSAQRGITISGTNNIYTSGNGGVFRSSNNGANFVNHNFTFSATPIITSDYFAVLKILVGTTGSVNGGVWSYVDAIIQNVSGEPGNVSGYELSQNFPNPFNPVTKIRFDIPQEARSETLASRSGRDVKLLIYDALGKELMKLVEQRLSPGSYQVDFDGSNFSSGIYYYTLESGDFLQTKKMLLIK